ncbi:MULTISPECIES: hypothetical protein [unclassified Gilliamella]|uniref:hypothetical protein n=1 Tax=unclassified Gilliamella TaxID=2685620 RepID=UPI00132A6852|nr:MULTISPECIES: hypothetical protein [unclassified Gilliamella]MWN31155.1 hypothetical protein [Gilliamella sp. Pra-s60]MWP29792.1 hypothetical protein [Gilliamella sp. Pra-s54]
MASGIWHLACQTYALNLIDSHGGQKQAPQLFSSPKSFRVAKSTPSLAKSSAKLSPISKWLSKPSLLSKSSLFFAPLLLLSYTQGAQALTAQTSRVIEGSAPYLTLDGGRTKVTNSDGLLSIRLQDGRVITPSANPSSATNPISLPYVGSNLSHIAMIVPPSQSSITINDLVSQGNWGDDDGDGQGTNGVTATGSISVSFTDKNGNTVSRSDALDICNAPYKVTLTSTAGNLTTQYGVPNITSFGSQTVDYYIKPNTSPVICSSRPNLRHGSRYDNSWGIDFAGPSNIWDSAKGFLTQSTSSSSYGNNFPTTGSDGLYFDLDISGVDASQLIWSPVSHNGITATVSWTRPRSGTFREPSGRTVQADSWISDKSKYVTRITLKGPEARNQINNDNPNLITVPTLPQEFELEGHDSQGNVVVKYGFVLRQWFVNRGDKKSTALNQMTWCRSLGYQLPRVRDLTNAVCSGWHSGNWCQGAVGATPSSPQNTYQRRIGTGFFSEWGFMSNYADAGFVPYSYWTSDVANNFNFPVHSGLGNVDSSTSLYRYGLCVVP